MRVKIISAAHHRNGVSGIGFTAVVFDYLEAGEPIRRMVASLFPSPTDPDNTQVSGLCAVYQLDLLAQGNVKFGQNSWRGDQFEPTLRAAVAKWEEKHPWHVPA